MARITTCCGVPAPPERPWTQGKREANRRGGNRVPPGDHARGSPSLARRVRPGAGDPPEPAARTAPAEDHGARGAAAARASAGDEAAGTRRPVAAGATMHVMTAQSERGEHDLWLGVEVRHLAALRAVAEEGTFGAAA